MRKRITTDCLYYLVSRVSLSITAVLKRGFAEANVEMVRPAYLGVLLNLWQEDRLQATELGRRAGLEPSSMTGILDRMERDGLIQRLADPADRRAQRIALTPIGNNVRQPVTKVVDQTIARVTRGLSAGEEKQIKSVLKRVLDNAQEERK